MAATVIGSELVTWGTAQDPTAQTITIPSDCTAVYLVHTDYTANGAGYITAATLGGVAAAAIGYVTAANSYNQCSVAVWYSPTTGSASIDIALGGANLIEGPVSHAIYVKGGDLTAWRDVDAAQAGGSTAVSVTLTTQSGDLVIKYDARYSGTTPPSLSSGWTSIATGDANARSARASYISASGTTQVCDSEDESYSSVIAFAIPSGVVALDITPGVGTLTAVGLVPVMDYGMPLAVGALTAEGFAPTFIERGSRYAYPTADVTAGNWLPSTGSDLYAMIDEEPASDTDYIYTNAAGACEIRLLPVTDPASSSGYAVNYRIWSPVGGNAVVRLKQGATTIATWTHTGLPTTPTDYSQSLAGAEADAITDHDDLRLEIEAT